MGVSEVEKDERYEDCPECDGSGYVVCDVCDGSGKVEEDDDD